MFQDLMMEPPIVNLNLNTNYQETEDEISLLVSRLLELS